MDMAIAVKNATFASFDALSFRDLLTIASLNANPINSNRLNTT